MPTLLVPGRRFLIIALSPLCVHIAGGQTARTMQRGSCVDTSAFIERTDRDTVGASTISLTDSTFASDVRAVAQSAYMRLRGQRNASGIRTLHLEIWGAPADTAGPPTQIGDVEVGSTVVTARVASPTRGVQLQRDSIRQGTQLYMSHLPIFLELLVHAAHPAVGDSVRVPVLWLFTGGTTDQVTVRRVATDSIVVEFPERFVRIHLAPDGSLASATTQPRPGAAGTPSTLIRLGCN